MKNINFNVSQDTIEKLSDDVIISDSFNYVCLIFNFDSSWSQYNVKKATFFSDYEDGEQQYEADIVNNVCVVPYEILQKSKFKSDFMVGVYGQVIQDGTLQQRNTTNMVVFSLRQGAYFVNALNPGEIDPSAYDLYLAKLQQIFQNGLNEYNSNANEKTTNFDENYKNKKSEIDAVAEVVSKDKLDIEEMKKSIETSEINAKTSEKNAKTSEENAQKSAENAENSYQATVNIATNLSMLAFYVDENLKLHVVSESDLVNQKFNLVGNKLEVIYFAN